MSLFDHRKNLKPFEYPDLYKYVSAIRHSYWIHTEYNFTSDIQDFKVNISDSERECITRTMLAIAQIEVWVKTFWGSLYNGMPKPEIGAVWQTFAESECRHMDAYAHLLEILWLNKAFEDIENIPVINWRIDYMQEFINKNKLKTNKDYIRAVALFSLFIEHVSLFSQFLIMMAFNKHKNLFKGISNVIEATSKEEQIHWLFGIDIINTLRQEKPEWFDEALEKEILWACEKAFKAEDKILDWIFEHWELDFLPKEEVTEFLKYRFNSSLSSIGYTPIFDVDEKILEKTSWFDDELFATKHWDFFVKRSVNYDKKGKSITSDDLF